MLWYTRMSPPLAGVPRTMSKQSLGVDRPPTAVAYPLPRVLSSVPCFEQSQRAHMRQACTGPYGQHCNHCVHQPARWYALPSHVATRPPPPPLESEVFFIYSQTEGTLSTNALAHSWPWGHMPSRTDTMQSQGG